jgi:hypothetical protein
MTHQEIKELAGHRAVSPWVMKLVGDAVAKEREECAMLCLWHNNTMLSQTPTLFHMAELIRARGQA